MILVRFCHLNILAYVLISSLHVVLFIKGVRGQQIGLAHAHNLFPQLHSE